MANCGPSTLAIGRPTQSQYAAACGVGSTTVTFDGTSGCAGSGGCHAPTAPHDRTLAPRRYREKVREDIRDYVLLMLGAPSIKIELDDQALDLCVDQTLKIFEDFCGREYYDYYTFIATPGKSVYKLPDEIGVVRNVFYMEQARTPFTANDLGGSIPLEYFYPGGAYGSLGSGMINPVEPMWGRMGEWVLYKQYEQMFARTSSRLGGWEWVSDMRHIKLYPTPCGGQRVIVHYLQKCKDWKEVTQAMQEGALAHAMVILGHIRGKYASPPGPGGGMQLDGDYMRTKGWELLDKWKEELITKFGDILYISLD